MQDAAEFFTSRFLSDFLLPLVKVQARIGPH
jgi:hypothetical protein